MFEFKGKDPVRKVKLAERLTGTYTRSFYCDFLTDNSFLSILKEFFRSFKTIGRSMVICSTVVL